MSVKKNTPQKFCLDQSVVWTDNEVVAISDPRLQDYKRQIPEICRLVVMQ